MHWRPFFLSGLVLACCVSGVNAQESARSIRRPAASVLFASKPPAAGKTAAADTSARQPTHWRTGLLVGGTIGAGGLGAFLYSFCRGVQETRGSCLDAGLVGATLGAVIGGTVGALVGGQIPKRDTPPAADSTAVSQ